MPIYVYRCESCGHVAEVLQKMSEPALTTCPACAQPALQKQVTAAGFQLKGSGWYATDFRSAGAASVAAASSSGAAVEAAPANQSASGDAASMPAPATCGASCACH